MHDSSGTETLQALVTLARTLLGARAVSIALLDATGHELVFEAVAGEGAGELPGARFPATQGIAGAALAAGAAVVVDDVSADPTFAVGIATEIGYVPDAIMAAPLRQDDRVVGVLSVLDRDRGRPAGDAAATLERLAAHAGLLLSAGRPG